MPELVAGTHADQRVLRLEDRQDAVADRSPATVMAHLEHIDVAEYVLVDQRLQHVALCIPVSNAENPGALASRTTLDSLADASSTAAAGETTVRAMLPAEKASPAVTS